MGTPHGATPEKGTRLLKRDVFGRVECVVLPRGMAARRVAAAEFGCGWIARVLLRRERRALLALDGCPGVPRLVSEREFEDAPSPEGARPRGAVLVRSWLAGTPLHEAQALPEDFFERLEELVRELHARGVCHNDLHKEQNVLLGDDGFPYLIDFQLASVHRRRARLFESRCGDDLRHVSKHHRRYTRRGTKPGESGANEPSVPRRSVFAALWLWTGKPLYVFVTRRLLRTRDGEARRPNTGPWPTWTAPVGPRPGRDA